MTPAETVRQALGSLTGDPGTDLEILTSILSDVSASIGTSLDREELIDAHAALGEALLALAAMRAVLDHDSDGLHTQTKAVRGYGALRPHTTNQRLRKLA